MLTIYLEFARVGNFDSHLIVTIKIIFLCIQNDFNDYSNCLETCNPKARSFLAYSKRGEK